MAFKRVDPNAAPKQALRAADQPLILYVEDELPNWDLAHATLLNKYEMVRAKNSAQAFDELLRQEFRAILMDIQLANSEFNGIEITRILSGVDVLRTPPAVKPLVGKAPPIIFVTAYNARYTKDDLLKYGGSELIAKPIDFLALTNAITRCLLRGITNTLRASEV